VSVFDNIRSQYCYCMSFRANCVAFYAVQSSIGCMGMLGMSSGSTISGDLVGGGKRLQIFKASRGGTSEEDRRPKQREHD